VRASQLGIATANAHGMDVRASQLAVVVAAQGRVADPTVRAFTFTLDGHDFYAIHLGRAETLLYDVATQEWHVWGSGDADVWRAYYGANWLGGRRLSANYGSSVVVTDDGNGSLYFLAPADVSDDDPVYGEERPRPFLREVTGQVVLPSGYASVPCFGVQLMGSIGKTDESDLTVELSVSDDRGETFQSVGTKLLSDGEYSARLNWQSLGSMVAPGRLFRVADYGALQRVDALTLEDGQ
jgi:hypothetical protein